MAQSTPSEDRDVRADSEYGSRNDSVSLYPDSDPTNSSARPSFLAELASTIESVVIPRLQLKIENGPDSMAIDQAMVRTFVDKLMRGESRDAMRHVEALLERGLSMDHLLVDLLMIYYRKSLEFFLELFLQRLFLPLVWLFLRGS